MSWETPPGAIPPNNRAPRIIEVHKALHHEQVARVSGLSLRDWTSRGTRSGLTSPPLLPKVPSGASKSDPLVQAEPLSAKLDMLVDPATVTKDKVGLIHDELARSRRTKPFYITV